MPLKEILRNYLESEIKTDSELREKYNSEKLDQLEAFINDEARKMLHGRSGAIQDSTVFEWCRSFFVDGIQIQMEQKKTIPSVKKEKGHVINDKQLTFKF